MRMIQSWNIFNAKVDPVATSDTTKISCGGKGVGGTANLCRVVSKDFLFPGDILSLQPDNSISGVRVAVEPRVISKTFVSNSWPPPCLVDVEDDGLVRLHNSTDSIIPVYKNDHLCQLYHTKTLDYKAEKSSPAPKVRAVHPSAQPYSLKVCVDPDSQLSAEEKNSFVEQHLKYDELFEPTIGRYNDFAGKVRARVNLGRTIPPSRKLQVPQYDKKNLDLLQDKFDELERQGVFADLKILGSWWSMSVHLFS